jgi:hypothetical protein
VVVYQAEITFHNTRNQISISILWGKKQNEVNSAI